MKVITMQNKAMNTRVMWMVATWSLLVLGSIDRLYGQPATPPEVSVPAVYQQADNGTEDGLIPTKSLLGMIREGGVLMFPIGFCSFVLLVFVFERSVALRRGRVIPRPGSRSCVCHDEYPTASRSSGARSRGRGCCSP